MGATRLLYILAILQQGTNQHKSMTVHDIYRKLMDDRLEKRCSEQRVRSDLGELELLSLEGVLPVKLEIEHGAHNQKRYKVYHPGFGLNEARMVFDSISISKFLSPKQKNELISQLEGFLSEKEVHQLKQRVQVKSCLMQNEQLPQTLQCLYQAMDEHRCLNFTYCKFDLKGHQQPVKHYRRIQPLQVIWEKEHYYLVALNPEHQEADQQRNYRVDRMARVTLDEPFWRKAASMPAHYGQFEMFSAQKICRVTFRVHRDLLDMAFETFGTGICPCEDPEKPDWVRFSAESELSAGFLRWVMGQADKIEVLGPPEVRAKVKNLLQTVSNYYRE